MTEKVTSVIVPLEFPVTVEGVEYKQLTFRRMKAKDTLAGEGTTDPTQAGFSLYAALAGVPVEVIHELDMEDLTEVGVKVAPLMGKRAAAKIQEELAKLSPGAASS